VSVQEVPSTKSGTRQLVNPSKRIEWIESVTACSDFQRRFWVQGIDLADGHSKTVYGRVHSHNTTDPRHSVKFVL
jgi:hypothetical protein